MNFPDSLSTIRKALTLPLPGTEGQHLMAPASRKTSSEYLRERKTYKDGGVMLLLFPDAREELQLVMIERPVNSSIHSGRISFPGGRKDDNDADIAMTALRETHEEIGVPIKDIEIVGTLTTLFIPASNFLVHPHIGFTNTVPEFKPNSSEVKSIIIESITNLLQLEPKSKSFHTSYGLLPAPYFDIQGHAVWGATAMMLSEFREMMRRTQHS